MERPLGLLPYNFVCLSAGTTLSSLAESDGSALSPRAIVGAFCGLHCASGSSQGEEERKTERSERIEAKRTFRNLKLSL